MSTENRAEPPNAPLRRTPLYETHRAQDAKIVPFAGWEMPLQYSGIVEEHRAVRERVGLFDVSHMGEILFTGPRAQEAVQRLVTNNVGKLPDGQALYTVVCNERGGIVDDCVVYRHGPERWLIVVNAGNIDKDRDWFVAHAGDLCTIEDQSAVTALIALQGPRAQAVLDKGFVGTPALAGLKAFSFSRGTAFDVPVVASRTGYTGEDGFELFCPAGGAVDLWKALLAAGESEGIRPCGLGARDTLRLEARLCLYGQDLDDDTTPLEAGLGWVVKLGEADFVGKLALAAQKEKGVARRLVGLRSLGRGIPRHGYPILEAPGGAEALGGRAVGTVTSGTRTPTVDVGIAMGYVETGQAEPGTKVVVDCRGKPQLHEVVKGPFYKRSQQSTVNR